METSLLFIILVIVVSVSTIFFFIKRNQEDKKDFMEKLIKNDEVSIPKEHDTKLIPQIDIDLQKVESLEHTSDLKLLQKEKSYSAHIHKSDAYKRILKTESFNEN